MRINTDGKKAWRNDLYERTADVLGESTKAGAIDSACIHAKQDAEAKQEAIEYLSHRLPAAELEKAADILSTDELNVCACLDVNVKPDE
ncbi:DUF7692 domain-containing protein [Halovenus salina]|uniref:DUF7692 domain-containing protein n=1 Tax=Halovenus salina TaxID=1510225 RepID=A0ABD5W422_9EURY|nr:hypothetical protein [Halovenus salina]